MPKRAAEPFAERSATAEPPDPLSVRRAAAALAALGASAACFITAESLPIGLLPQLAGSMHTSLSTTGLLVTIYALVVVAATVPLSHLTRSLPRRQLLAAVAGALVVGSLGSMVAPDFAMLLASRIFTAIAQSIFWAVGPVEAAGLVPAHARGRAVTAVFAGSALGQILGLPAGTAVGHALGWRFAFLALAAAAVVLLVAVLVALPRQAPAPRHAQQARGLDRRRYRVLVGFTALTVTAYFTMFTYASAFLVKVSGLPRASVALVLLGAGLASTVGLASGGTLYYRHRRATIPGAIALALVALVALFALARSPVLAPCLFALVGLGQSVFTVAGQTAVIEIGPINGTAWYSTAFNVGIGAGPLVGGLALQQWGLRSAPLAGAVVSAGALAFMFAANGQTRGHRR